jgi:methionyl-tRNA formyltransferase
MLMQLINAGHEPTAIIEETGSIADEEREKFLERIKGYRVAPTFEELLKDKKILQYQVQNHNNEECRKILEEVKPNLGVLGGTRILKNEILQIPKDGMLNSHPGLLPEVRGSASPAWSVYFDIPIGSTCHFIDPDIDTGDIVARREIGVKLGDTYESLCWKTLVMAGTLMVAAVTMWKENSIIRKPQGKSEFPTFRVPPREVLQVVYKKLEEGTYKHFRKLN